MDLPQTTPVTIECVITAARQHQVPFALLIGIMATERGQVGKYSGNTNKTADYGPMQINTHWLPKLKKLGVNSTNLLNNGCLNVSVGAWILGNELRTSNSLWDGVGHYHSHTLKYKNRYIKKVFRSIQSIRFEENKITKIIQYANKG